MNQAIISRLMVGALKLELFGMPLNRNCWSDA